MARLGRSLEEYAENGGWSSHHFAENAVPLIKSLMSLGAEVKIGRHVIHVKNGKAKLKAYPHFNGRSEEYVTITDMKGQELFTAHYTKFDELAEFVLLYLGLKDPN